MITLRDFAPQGAVYDGLMHSIASDTMVHAYLISGAEGIGKKTLADALTQYLLCTSDGKRPCGTCKACVQAERGEHPDMVTIQLGKPLLEENKKIKSAIPVSEIREAVRICSTATYAGGKRVVRIWQAEKMNPAAQNALLKTLEEPPEGTIFLLTTESPRLLLPTIVSRCRELHLHAWPDDVIRRALVNANVPAAHLEESIRLCEGSIGKALTLAGGEKSWALREELMRTMFDLQRRSDIPAISADWKNRSDQADEMLNTLEDMVNTLLRHRLGKQANIAAYPAVWQEMAEKADLKHFVTLLDEIARARMLRENHVTWQAVVEQLLLRLMEGKTRWQT